MRKLILHIGRHKSGTTALQYALLNNQNELADSGIYYPQTGVREYAHHLVSETIASDGEKSLNNSTIKDLLEELNAVKHEWVLISSEGFQNCDPSVVAKIFKSFQIYIICYIRNHLSYLKSSYLQTVHASKYYGSVEDYLKGFNIDYLDFYNSWVNVFGSSSVYIREFERERLVNRDIVDDFFSLLRAEFNKSILYQKVKLDGFQSNASLKGDCIWFKILVNRYINEPNSSVLYRTLGMYSHEYNGGDAVISPEVKEQLTRKYAHSNERLKKLLGWPDNSLSLPSVQIYEPPESISLTKFIRFYNKLKSFNSQISYLDDELFSYSLFPYGDNLEIRFSHFVSDVCLEHVYLNSCSNYIPLSLFKKSNNGYYIFPDYLVKIQDVTFVVKDEDAVVFLRQERVEGAIEKRIVDTSKMPDSYWYWKKKYLDCQLKQVFGSSSVLEILSNGVVKCSKNKNGLDLLYLAPFGLRNLLSIVDGIVDKVSINSISAFVPMISDAEKSDVEKALLSKYGNKLKTFMSSKKLSGSYDAIISHSFLSSLPDYDVFYKEMVSRLKDEGCLIIYEYVGDKHRSKSGKALKVTQKIWSVLPTELKNNVVKGVMYDEYIDDDISTNSKYYCSSEKLRNSLAKDYRVEKKLSYGSLIDLFSERRFGYAYDVARQNHLLWIDYISELDELLISEGVLEPNNEIGYYKKLLKV